MRRCLLAMRDLDAQLMDQVAAELILSDCEVTGCHSAREALSAAMDRQYDVAVVAFRLLDTRADTLSWRLIALQPHLREHIILLVEPEDIPVAGALAFPWIPMPANVETIITAIHRRTQMGFLSGGE